MIIRKMIKLSHHHDGDYRIIREIKDYFLTRFYLTFEFSSLEKHDEVHIAFSILMTIDEVYWLQNRTSEHMDKFNNTFTEALGKYVRRYLV